jgi:hypothetical protein
LTGRRLSGGLFVIWISDRLILMHCKIKNAAMQTKRLSLVSGIRRLSLERSDLLSTRNKGTNMSNTASLDFAPSATLFGRLMASIDRLLLAYAEKTIRNGDIQRFDV